MRSCNLCGEPWATHTTACRTTQPPTADATASARLTAEADADGTGSRVEEPERVCARCWGNQNVCETRADDLIADGAATNSYGRALAADMAAANRRCAAAIREACLAAHHWREDAVLIAEAMELHKWCHETGKGGRPSTEIIERLAARLEGGKR